MPITLKQNTELRGATGEFGHPIQTYDDCGEALYVYGKEYGASMIINANSWEAAYGIAIDESATIPEEEVFEAYGSFEWLRESMPELWPEYFQVYRKPGEGKSMGPQTVADILFAMHCEKLLAEDEEYPELQEGYQYQSNASGTGIVETGYYEWLQELTPEYLCEAKIKLVVRHRDCDCDCEE